MAKKTRLNCASFNLDDLNQAWAADLSRRDG